MRASLTSVLAGAVLLLACASPAAAGVCPNGPAEPGRVMPQGTVKLVGGTRSIRKRSDVLTLQWTNKRIASVTIRWFRGCRRGYWLPKWTAGPEDGQPKRAKFTSLSAPRGKLELWAEVALYPRASFTGPPLPTRLTRIGTVHLARTIPLTSAASHAEVEDNTPDAEVPLDDALYPSHVLSYPFVVIQRAALVRSFVAVQVCRAKTCSVFRDARKEELIPAQSFSEIQHRRGKPDFRYDDSFKLRDLTGPRLDLSAQDKTELRLADEGGADVRLVSRTEILDPVTGAIIDAGRFAGPTYFFPPRTSSP